MKISHIVSAFLAAALLLAPTAAADAEERTETTEAVKAADGADPRPGASAPVTHGDAVISGRIAITLGKVTAAPVTARDVAVHRAGETTYVSRELGDGLQVLAVQTNRTMGVTEHIYTFAGKYLERLNSGHVVVRDGDRYGEPVGLVDPAWAKDAVGAPVPTAFKVSGNTLIQTVTTTAETVFPVTSDPKVRHYWWGVSVDFNKKETKAISQGGGACVAAVSLAGTPGKVISALCGVHASIAAVADGQGRCFSARWLVAGSMIYPWIRKC